MRKCKATGGIKSILIFDKDPITLTLDPTKEQVEKINSARSHSVNVVILSPYMERLVKFIKSEIEQHERDQEEYIQDLDNQEMSDLSGAKAEALQTILNFIYETKTTKEAGQ